MEIVISTSVPLNENFYRKVAESPRRCLSLSICGVVSRARSLISCWMLNTPIPTCLTCCVSRTPVRPSSNIWIMTLHSPQLSTADSDNRRCRECIESPILEMRSRLRESLYLCRVHDISGPVPAPSGPARVTTGGEPCDVAFRVLIVGRLNGRYSIRIGRRG